MNGPRPASGGQGVETDPAARDPRLRGRTYAIPFDRVWTAALSLAGEQRGWSVLRADDQSGEIFAEVSARLLPFIDDVKIRIGLDEDAQTRVDLSAHRRGGKADLGANARRVARFLKRLDRSLEATRAQILAQGA